MLPPSEDCPYDEDKLQVVLEAVHGLSLTSLRAAAPASNATSVNGMAGSKRAPPVASKAMEIGIVVSRAPLCIHATPSLLLLSSAHPWMHTSWLAPIAPILSHGQHLRLR
jgi:hypothetical protein